MDQKKLVMEDTEKVVPLHPSKPVSGNGGGGDGGNIAYRLGEVERRVATLERKVDDVRDTCTKISTKMEESPSKAHVLWHTVCLVAFMLLTLLGHILIRGIGTY